MSDDAVRVPIVTPMMVVATIVWGIGLCLSAPLVAVAGASVGLTPAVVPANPAASLGRITSSVAGGVTDRPADLYGYGIVIAAQLWLIWIAVSLRRFGARLMVATVIVAAGVAARVWLLDVALEQAWVPGIAVTLAIIAMLWAAGTPRWSFGHPPGTRNKADRSRLRRFGIRTLLVMMSAVAVASGGIRMIDVPMSSMLYWTIAAAVWGSTAGSAVMAFTAATHPSRAVAVAYACAAWAMCGMTVMILMVAEGRFVEPSATPVPGMIAAAKYIYVYAGFAAAILVTAGITRVQSVTIGTTDHSAESSSANRNVLTTSRDGSAET